MSLQALTIAPDTELAFDDLIAPISVEEFISEYWQKKPCHIPGPRDKFRDLFSWEELNHLLESHHFAHPRFRMSKGGADVTPKEYMETLRFTKGNRVDPEGLHRQFSQGATIIIQHADEFCPPLQHLATALETALGWHAEIEVIAGCGTSNGLGIHADGNDCLVFEIEGTKLWRFYEPTRVGPLKSSKIFPHRYDALPAAQPNPDHPVLSVEVTAGDFVYIPRGWWHLVKPRPGPCLSLNPTVYGATVQDFLRWLVDELSIEPACRANIPIDGEAQEAILREVESAIVRQLTGETVGKYQAFVANEMETSSSICLPSGPSTNRLLQMTSAVVIPVRRPLHVSADLHSGLFRVRWKGADKHFSKEHLPLFAVLNDGRQHLVSDLLATCGSPQSRLSGLAFLLDLWERGIACS
jgi:ribosomal protein L16 Arg81 hydroxylase